MLMNGNSVSSNEWLVVCTNYYKLYSPSLDGANIDNEDERRILHKQAYIEIKPKQVRGLNFNWRQVLQSLKTKLQEISDVM